MTSVFADTFYFLALVNNSDQGHAKAVAFTKSYVGRLITTGWVLTELGDALAGSANGRAHFGLTLKKLQADPNVVVHPCEHALFMEGAIFYSERPDKAWTLTDCISFVVMTREGVTESLTGDHHFEQAGFTA